MHSPQPGQRPTARSALLLLASLALTLSCSLERAATPTPAESTPTASPPTEVPTPLPPRVVLVAPDAAEAAIAGQAGLALQALAAGSGWEFTRLNALPDGDSSAITLLVAVPPDLGLQAWADAHPLVQTAALGIAGLQSAPNLSRIAADGLRFDQLGFALGYLAAMVTPEYRMGALARDTSPPTLALARGFVAGGTYYCGLCRPTHPPYVAYPVLLEGTEADLASAGLTTLLVAPPPASLADLGLAPSAGIAFLGLGAPPGDLAGLWIASADFDVDGAVRLLWEQVQRGEGGATYPLTIRFHSVDNARVSEGRLRFAEALLEDLAAGRIDTGIDPQTGQLR
jgi:hypothetical protein